MFFSSIIPSGWLLKMPAHSVIPYEIRSWKLPSKTRNGSLGIGSAPVMTVFRPVNARVFRDFSVEGVSMAQVAPMRLIALSRSFMRPWSEGMQSAAPAAKV